MMMAWMCWLRVEGGLMFDETFYETLNIISVPVF
jgi:hypothetical protein